MNKKIVTIGGGTGMFAVITALRTLKTEPICIVAVSDSGGSSGRLKDEFGFPPVGDLRQSLTALANSKSQAWIQRLLLYRFEKGQGLVGHNLGNLILTALQDITGSTSEALNLATKIFQFGGQIIPVTETKVELEIFYQDGSVVKGEHHLDSPTASNQPIKKVALTPPAKLNPIAQKVLRDADFIIVGPGDLYASLIASLMVKNLQPTLRQSSAKLVYVTNLMTRYSQTDKLSAKGHVNKIEQALGKKFDYIIVNNGKISDKILRHYQKAREYPVIDDLAKDKRVIRVNLVDHETHTQAKVDQVSRSLLRHSSQKLASCLKEIF